jgi:hypothetical protein
MTTATSGAARRGARAAARAALPASSASTPEPRRATDSAGAGIAPVSGSRARRADPANTASAAVAEQPPAVTTRAAGRP